MINGVPLAVAVQVVKRTGEPMRNMHAVAPPKELCFVVVAENRTHGPSRAHFVDEAHVLFARASLGSVTQKADDVWVAEAAVVYVCVCACMCVFCGEGVGMCL